MFYFFNYFQNLNFKFLSILINFLIRILGGGNYPDASLVSRKELELMIDEEGRGDVREVEKKMIRKIYGLNNRF